MNTCKTCKYRISGNGNDSREKRCTHPKIREDDGPDPDDKDDELLYSYFEDGWFAVGDNFGCIHHKEK